MGEIADMMLDGTLCEGCGVYLDNIGGDGFPRRCHACRTEFNRDFGPPKMKCPTCRKSVKVSGLANHQKDAHGAGAISGKVPCTMCNKQLRPVGVADHMRDAHGVKSA